MFCENCGTKNADDAAFCENCGARLAPEIPAEQAMPDMQGGAPFTAPEAAYVPPQPAMQIPAAPRKPMSKKTKAIIIAAVALAVVLFGGFQLLKSMASPDKVAKGYFESIVNGNYEEAYSYLDVAKSEFITAENFANVMKEKNGEAEDNVLNFSVTEEKPDRYYDYYSSSSDSRENALKKVYRVEYTKQGEEETYSETIILLKQNSKKFLFFDDYKVAANNLVATDYEIRVPSGSQVYINDALVSDSYKVEKEDGYSYLDYYVIPAIFEGNYSLKVTGSYMKDFENSIYIDDYDDYTTVSRVELNDDTNAQLKAKAEEYIRSYVTNAIGGKEFDSLSGYYCENADISGAEKAYNKIAEKRFNSEKGTGVTEFNFASFEFICDDEYVVDNKYCITCEYEYAYTSYYKYWSDDEPEEYSPEEYEKKKTSIYFVLENGEWKISSGSVNMYFYC